MKTFLAFIGVCTILYWVFAVGVYAGFIHQLPEKHSHTVQTYY